MELMEGESLAHRIRRLGRLSLPETQRFVTHVARALARAHELGIVHRDLKPDNIFLVRNEDEEIAKVLDFGIAKANAQLLGHSSATRTGTIMGTPHYMSPEQITGAKGLDHRTDLWALGVIACECLTGSQPFGGETIGALVLAICAQEPPKPSSLAPVPAGFDAWFARATARVVAERFASARELSDALRTLSADAPMVTTGQQQAGSPGQTLGMTTGMSPHTAGFTVPPVSRTHTAVATTGAVTPQRKLQPLLIAAAASFVLIAGGAAWLLSSSSPVGERPQSPSTLATSAGPPELAKHAAAGAAASAAPKAVTPIVIPMPSANRAASASASTDPVKAAPARPATNPARPAPQLPSLPVLPLPQLPAIPQAPARQPAPATPPPANDPNSVFDRRKG
jgi:serine/threonine-protein kinase